MGSEGEFDFSVYYRAAQKRDREPLTPLVLSFPRGEVGPNTAGWKSKKDHFHRHRCQCTVLITFVRNKPTDTSCFLEPGHSWMPGLPPALWLRAVEVTLQYADQN